MVWQRPGRRLDGALEWVMSTGERWDPDGFWRVFLALAACSFFGGWLSKCGWHDTGFVFMMVPIAVIGFGLFVSLMCEGSR